MRMTRRRRTVSPARHRCASCGRTPLVGERVHVCGKPGSEHAICHVCVIDSQAGAFGDELRTERVHTTARPLVVRAVAA